MSTDSREQHFNSQFDSRRDFTFYDGRPEVYLIASTPRSGSHYLGHLMQSTGMMGDPLEYLQPAHLDRWMSVLQTSDMLSTFDELYKRRTSPNGVFGLKAHYNQTKQYGGVRDIVDALCVKKIIYVTRIDKIAQVVSYSIARQTKSWISEDQPLGTAVYDYLSMRDCLVGVLAQEYGWSSYFRRSNMDVTYVSYESLCVDPVGVVRTLAGFLGVEAAGIAIEASAQTRKQRGGQSVEWGERFISEYVVDQRRPFIDRMSRRLRGVMKSFLGSAK